MTRFSKFPFTHHNLGKKALSSHELNLSRMINDQHPRWTHTKNRASTPSRPQAIDHQKKYFDTSTRPSFCRARGHFATSMGKAPPTTEASSRGNRSYLFTLCPIPTGLQYLIFFSRSMFSFCVKKRQVCCWVIALGFYQGSGRIYPENGFITICDMQTRDKSWTRFVIRLSILGPFGLYLVNF